MTADPVLINVSGTETAPEFSCKFGVLEDIEPERDAQRRPTGRLVTPLPPVIGINRDSMQRLALFGVIPGTASGCVVPGITIHLTEVIDERTLATLTMLQITALNGAWLYQVHNALLGDIRCWVATWPD